MKKKNEELTFKDILDVFIPKIWLIAVVAVVFAVLLGASAMLKSNTYTSSSTMVLKKNSDSQSQTDLTYAESSFFVISIRLASDEFLETVRADILKTYPQYEGMTTAYLRSVISYTSIGGGVFKISATTTDQLLSFAIVVSVEDLVDGVIGDYFSGYFAVESFQAPKLAAPNDKGTVKNALIGFIGGAVVSAVVVWIYAAFDTVIRDKKKLESHFEFPILGVIPEGSVEQEPAKEA